MSEKHLVDPHPYQLRYEINYVMATNTNPILISFSIHVIMTIARISNSHTQHFIFERVSNSVDVNKTTTGHLINEISEI